MDPLTLSFVGLAVALTITPGANAVLVLSHALITLVWLSAYVYFIGQLGALLQRPRVQRIIEPVTGAALPGFGVRLALSRR